MKISVSSYSFNQLVKTGEMTLIDCVRKAHEMGFDAIEFIDVKGETQEERLENAKAIRIGLTYKNLDEDEMYRFIKGDFRECPYYQFGDEYQIVRKQI